MAGDEIGRVPQALRVRACEIIAMSDGVCAEHLDEEHAILCRRLVAKLARKRPFPIVRGDERVWAAGALYAVGQNNVLFDATQTPHLSGDDLRRLTGVFRRARWRPRRSANAMPSTRNGPMDPEFCRRELLAEHPFAWLVEVDGLIVDARPLPAALQVEARRRGLIPDLALDEAA